MLNTHTANDTTNERNAAMNWLLAVYPLAFDLCNRQPLKNAILDDILSVPKEDMPTKEQLEAAMHFYCHWGSYLHATIAGAKRIDLNGNVCDTVSADEEAEAKSKINLESQKIEK